MKICQWHSQRIKENFHLTAAILVPVNYMQYKLTALAKSGLTNEMLTCVLQTTNNEIQLPFCFLPPFSIFVVSGHKTHCLVPLMTAPWNRGWAFWEHLQRNWWHSDDLDCVPYDLRLLCLALVALKPSMFSEQSFPV